MPELILVRHARTTWTGMRYCGRSDPPLDPAGLASAADLAARLAMTLPEHVRILSSPRRRAVQTAQAIAQHSGRDIDVDDRWAEVDFGDAEGLTFEELEDRAPAMAAGLVAGWTEVDWPGGETAAAFTVRVEAAWHDLAARTEATVVVSHGGPLRIAIGLASGRPSSSVAVPEPGEVYRIELPASRRLPYVARTS